MRYQLGKKAPVAKKSLSFNDYVTLLPSVPLTDAAPAFAYNMDENDRIGDCVVAAWDHARQTITGLLTGVPKTFSVQEIESFYKTQNPNFPAQDNGMDIQTFLEYLAANKHILGFAKIDHTNEQEMKAATYIGISVIAGVQLQQAQENQFASGTWDYVFGSPFVGGHAIAAVGYRNAPDQGTYVSWGREVQVTQNMVTRQMDEAWFVLLQEHIDHPTFRNHWNLAAFSQSVREITEGKIVIPVSETVPPASPVTKLDLWCEAAIKMEGADASLSNPGNVRYVSGTWMAKIAIGQKDGFCVFKDYQTGYGVLKELFANAATGKSEIYRPSDTLYQFYAKYAPASDNNDPNHYAEFVASAIGVAPTVAISTLV